MVYPDPRGEGGFKRLGHRSVDQLRAGQNTRDGVNLGLIEHRPPERNVPVAHVSSHQVGNRDRAALLG